MLLVREMMLLIKGYVAGERDIAGKRDDVAGERYDVADKR